MTTLERIQYRTKMRRIRKIKRICMLSVITLFLILTLTLTINVFCSMAHDKDSLTTYKYYTSIMIEDGDTLYSLADEYAKGYSIDTDKYIEEIMHINHLEDDMCIMAGQSLIIPYYSTQLKGI